MGVGSSPADFEQVAQSPWGWDSAAFSMLFKFINGAGASIMSSAVSSTISETRLRPRAGGGVKGERGEFIVDP
jgi:hypothetical protein